MTGRDPLRKIFISSRDTRTINLFNSLELWSPCYRYLSRKKKRKKTRELGLEKEKKKKKKKIEIYSSDKRDAQRDIYEIGSTSHPPRRNPSTQVVSHTSDDSDEWLDETTMLYLCTVFLYIHHHHRHHHRGGANKQASKQANVHSFTHRAHSVNYKLASPSSEIQSSRHDSAKKKRTNKIIIRSRDEFFERARAFSFFSPFFPVLFLMPTSN